MNTYIPLGLELLETLELPGDLLVGKKRLVLPQRPLAYLRVLCLGYSIFEVGFLEFVEADNDAEQFCQGVLNVALGARLGEFHLLGTPGQREGARGWSMDKMRDTSSRLIVADRFVLGT
jgi:hypothetical protein